MQFLNENLQQQIIETMSRAKIAFGMNSKILILWCKKLEAECPVINSGLLWVSVLGHLFMFEDFPIFFAILFA